MTYLFLLYLTQGTSWFRKIATQVLWLNSQTRFSNARLRNDSIFNSLDTIYLSDLQNIVKRRMFFSLFLSTMPIIQLTTLKVKFDDSPQLEFLTFVSKINLSVWGLFLFVFLFVFCFFQGEKIVWTDHITIYCIDKATETGPNWNVKTYIPTRIRQSSS